jgi:hypothetical protein
MSLFPRNQKRQPVFLKKYRVKQIFILSGFLVLLADTRKHRFYRGMGIFSLSATFDVCQPGLFYRFYGDLREGF